MPLIKIERDMLIDKVYECRSKIDVENVEAMKIISELVDLIVYAPLSDNQAAYPKIKIGRGR